LDSKNVLLVAPRLNDPRIQTEMYPSGALLLMGTMLSNLGHNVKIVHMATDHVAPFQLEKILSSFKPDIVGLTVNTFQTASAKQVSRIVKNINKDILVVIGGPHPSALGVKTFNDFHYVDIVVVGEGEHTFLDIVDGKKDLEEISGICYTSKMNKPRPLAKDLDYIPLPNLDLVDITRFIGASPIGAYPSMYIMASRGCPFCCTFCNKSVWGNTVRFRKPELIIKEIEWLHQRYGIKEIYFQDDTFNLNREWTERIFSLIIDHELNKEIVYKTPFRVNERLVDKELLQLAKDAGFWMIFYGVESGNQRMLDSMKKGITVAEIRRAFELTHEVGIKTIASFILGMPGETEQSIKDSVNLLKVLKTEYFGFSYAMPFPETELTETLIEKNHILETDYDKYSGQCIVRTDSLTREELISYYVHYIKKEAIKMKLEHMTLWEKIRKGVKHPILSLQIIGERVKEKEKSF